MRGAVGGKGNDEIRCHVLGVRILIFPGGSGGPGH